MKQTTNRAGLLPQFFQNARYILFMKRLGISKRRKHLAGFGGVMSILIQFGDQGFLARYVLLAFRSVALGQGEVLLERSAVHAAA